METGARLEAWGWVEHSNQTAAVAASLGVAVDVEDVKDMENFPYQGAQPGKLSEFQSDLLELNAVTVTPEMLVRDRPMPFTGSSEIGGESGIHRL